MNPYRNYFANQIQTASPEQVLIMLYDGAIRFLREARRAMENGDKPVKLQKVSRVVAILTELSNTLDFEKGGEIAENLDGLYWYMIRELTNPEAGDSTAPLDVSENILLELRDGWVQAMGKDRPEGQAQDGAQEQENSGTAPNPGRKSMNAAV